MIDWDGMLSGGDARTPALPEAGQGATPASEGADAPAGLPGIDDPERRADNRRRCAECGNLASNGRCLAVARRELVASRTYAGQGATPASEGADAPAGLPGIDDPERRADNRRRCAECGNLASNGRCLAVARRELVASRTYAPAPDWLRRCECFKPLANDPDQRPGRDRWPGL